MKENSCTSGPSATSRRQGKGKIVGQALFRIAIAGGGETINDTLNGLPRDRATVEPERLRLHKFLTY
jgi:hypothetical protein